MTKAEASNFVVRYWQFGVLMLTLAASYGVLTATVDALADDVKDAEEKIEQIRAKESDLDKKVVAVAVTQEAIKGDIEDIKAEQRAQSDKLDRILEKLSERN